MTINDQHYIKLFSNIIPVKGAKQSILCDSQRGEYRVIPNDLYDILTDNDGWKIYDLIKRYGEENRDVIIDYAKNLYKEECIFFCDTKEEINCFPKMDMEFKVPSVITNAILDIKASSNHDINSLINQLDILGCENIEIRIFEHVQDKVYEEICQALENSLIEFCVILTPFDLGRRINEYIDILQVHQRIAKIIIHSCPDDSIQGNRSKYSEWPIHFTKQVIDSSSCCGNVSPKFFNMDLRFISEAKKYNSCLNQKISIDHNGNIKNCPAMDESFGKLDSQKLVDVLQLEAFSAIWKINKDQIEVCKDCEFRYICHDCRALVQDPKDQMSKPLKCKYNPYLAEWAH